MSSTNNWQENIFVFLLIFQQTISGKNKTDMTLLKGNEITEEIKIEHGGTKVQSRRITKLLPPKGPDTPTPWGVRLKPVPRKTVAEEKETSGSKKTKTSSPKIVTRDTPKVPKVSKPRQIKAGGVLTLVETKSKVGF